MFAFSRTCSPNICIEKLFSALPASGGPPKRIFGKSSHKPCPVMLGSESKCRKTSHKARAEDVCASIKSERGDARWDEGKVFSGKISIVTRWAKSEYAILDFRSNRDSALRTAIDSEGRVFLFIVRFMRASSATRTCRPDRRGQTRKHPRGHPHHTGRSSGHPKYRGCRSPASRAGRQPRGSGWP